MINFVSWDSNEVIIVNVCVICKTFNPVAFGNNPAQKLTLGSARYSSLGAWL